MKKIILTSLICMLVASVYGQEIRVSVAPTLNAGVHYQFVSGGPGQKIKPGFSTLLDYYFITDKKITLGIGLNYTFSQLQFIPNMNTEGMIPHSENVSLISIRLNPRYRFKNQSYLIINPSIDFHLAHDSQQVMDNQSGIGILLGFGKNFEIKEAVFINVEPHLWIHNIIPFTNVNIPYHLTTIGLNLGLVRTQKDR